MTSRAAFRLVAKSVGATNREADGLRQTLLTRWAERGAVDELSDQLAAVDDASDRLRVWCSFDGDNDTSGIETVLSGLSEELQASVRAALDTAG